ncbi:MAG: protein-export chaperone SecB [Candidatus Paracaedimonas acanthamoebae]|uniref:Protein-export protein SecB n=1 Tax=Candidatus Paracaedimonas acanthamoebae TaxID=244581 RepID=A0A8J7PZM4_9PROT|nr:protein-export chaperone SecB [Candidatus Paracaedimonas acanthamoebae]
MAQNETQKPKKINGTPEMEPSANIPAMPLIVNAQYVKDISFENPSPLESLSENDEHAPEIELNIDIQAQPVSEHVYEVTLHLTAKAQKNNHLMFLAELQYAGVFTLASNLPQEAVHPILMIECPRLLFPYARSVLSTLTREGGFPALMLSPIDFLELYRNQYGSQENATQDS